MFGSITPVEALRAARAAYYHEGTKHAFTLESKSALEQSGFELLKTIEGEGGFSGTVYVHHAKKIVVLALRGTVPKKLETLWADKELYLSGKLHPQIVGGVTMLNDADVRDLIEEQGYSLEVVGHSLAGGLVQMLIYLIKRTDLRILSEKAYAALEGRIHGFAFDPASLTEMVKLLEPDSTHALGDHGIKDLPVTNFNAGWVPNAVNGIGGIGPGLSYALNMAHLDVLGTDLSVNSVKDLLATHDLENMLKCFDLATGFPKPGFAPEVSDWPKADFQGMKELIKQLSTSSGRVMAALGFLGDAAKEGADFIKGFFGRKPEGKSWKTHRISKARSLLGGEAIQGASKYSHELVVQIPEGNKTAQQVYDALKFHQVFLEGPHKSLSVHALPGRDIEFIMNFKQLIEEGGPEVLALFYKQYPAFSAGFKEAISYCEIDARSRLVTSSDRSLIADLQCIFAELNRCESFPSVSAFWIQCATTTAADLNAKATHATSTAEGAKQEASAASDLATRTQKDLDVLKSKLEQCIELSKIAATYESKPRRIVGIDIAKAKGKNALASTLSILTAEALQKDRELFEKMVNDPKLKDSDLILTGATAHGDGARSLHTRIAYSETGDVDRDERMTKVAGKIANRFAGAFHKSRKPDDENSTESSSDSEPE